ncbi:unnamed protein product [Ostreobium quekettii]|uniref:RRM domain-containing protein n=1 Tax=Ostreobium quekettii TaxID=121088 RepID=A0A8S1IYB1_9CHLO|nr:unnamed protein product [Ostreobium quekettii]
MPVFCGNFEYDAQARDIEKLFDKYGPIERIDMKTGFAFVYMEDKRDADDAIRALDRKEFGYKRRRLRVEWAKADGSIKAREDVRRKNAHPSDTLFVVNFDVHQTREQDIEYHFEPYGRLLRVQIKRNYAFVQFETVEQAAEALKRTHGTEMMGRPLTVEFVANEDPYMMRRSPPRKGRDRSYSPAYKRGRSRSRSPRRSPRRRYRSRSRSFSR